MKKENIFILMVLFSLSLCFVFFNSDSTNPLFVKIIDNVDDQIFQYLGYTMFHGKIPYTDYFDHKGLFLFFLDGLGYCIQCNYGILALQVLNLFFTLLISYWGSSFIFNKIYRISLTLSILLFLYPFYNGGNTVEEWSLPFIFLPIAIYLRNNIPVSKKFSNLNLFIIGVCIGLLLNLRFNNIAPVLGILLVCAIDAINKNYYNYIFRSFVFIILGVLITFVIALIYMLIVGGTKSLDDWLFCVFTFNIDYKATHGESVDLVSKFRYLFKTLLPCLALLCSSKNNKNAAFALFVGYLITLFTLGKPNYYHYLIIFIPLIFASLSLLYRSRYKYYIFIPICLFYSKTLFKQFSLSHFERRHDDTSVKLLRLLSNIPSDQRSHLWNYNGTFVLKNLRDMNVITDNYIFLLCQNNFSQQLYEKNKGKLQKSKPKYILFVVYDDESRNHLNNYCDTPVDIAFIKNNYCKISSVAYNDGILYCYKLKY